MTAKPNEILTGSQGGARGVDVYIGAWADLRGDTLFGFAAGDAIDITDLAFSDATLSFAQMLTGGALAVSNAAASLNLSVEGLSESGAFALAPTDEGERLFGEFEPTQCAGRPARNRRWKSSTMKM